MPHTPHTPHNVIPFPRKVQVKPSQQYEIDVTLASDEDACEILQYFGAVEVELESEIAELSRASAVEAARPVVSQGIATTLQDKSDLEKADLESWSRMIASAYLRHTGLSDCFDPETAEDLIQGYWTYQRLRADVLAFLQTTDALDQAESLNQLLLEFSEYRVDRSLSLLWRWDMQPPVQAPSKTSGAAARTSEENPRLSTGKLTHQEKLPPKLQWLRRMQRQKRMETLRLLQNEYSSVKAHCEENPSLS